MMCIPSANLELLAALQQDLHASLAGALALERWECAHDAARAAAATSAVTVVALGTRWARPCRALFGALARAVARYAEVAAAGVPVALRCVDHEASASFDLERVPIGVPATLVFVHGEPILFRLPVSPSASASASSATTGTTPAATTNQHNQDDEDEDSEDEQEDEDDEEDEEGTKTKKKDSTTTGDDQRVLRKCVMGALSAVQAEFFIERCVAAVSAAAAASAAATRTPSKGSSSSTTPTSLIVDLYEDLDSPFEQELQIRRRWRL